MNSCSLIVWGASAEVTCVPVVEASNSRIRDIIIIRQLLITFRAAVDDGQPDGCTLSALTRCVDTVRASSCITSCGYTQVDDCRSALPVSKLAARVDGALPVFGPCSASSHHAGARSQPGRGRVTLQQACLPQCSWRLNNRFQSPARHPPLDVK